MRVAWLVVLAGCELVFPLEGADPPCRFGAAEPVDEVAFGGAPKEEDPTVADVVGELWFVVARGAEDNDVLVANGGAAGFAMITPLAVNRVGVDDEDPTVTGDGSLMLFNQAGGVLQVTRSGPGADFGAPVSVGLDNLADLGGFDVTQDGLGLYLELDGQIVRATRASRDQPFTPPASLGVGGENPSISADELELFYEEADGRIVRRVRASPDEAFGPAESPIEGVAVLTGADPEISNDGTTLYFAANDTLMQATRDCR